MHMIDDTDDTRCHDKEASRWTKNLEQLNLKASPQIQHYICYGAEYTMHARFSSFVKQWVRREESSAKWRTRQKMEIQRCCWMEMEPRACMQIDAALKLKLVRSTFQLAPDNTCRCACEPWGVGRWHVAIPIRNVHGHVALLFQASMHARACRLAAHIAVVWRAARMARLMIPRDTRRTDDRINVLRLFYPLPLRSVYRMDPSGYR